MVKPITRSQPTSTPAPTAGASTSAQVDNNSTATGDASDTNMDVDQNEDDLQEEEPFVESGTLGEPSSSVNMDHGSTNMVTNEDEIPTDQELLQRLNEERKGLLEAKHAAVRRLAAGRASREEAEAAVLAVADKDRSIALMREMLMETPPVGQPSTSTKGKGNYEELPLKLPPGLTKFGKESNARLFLSELKSTITAYVGNNRFAKDAARYLRYYSGEMYRRQLDDELDPRENETIEWKELESIFLRITMPPRQRMIEIKNIVEMGRNPGESYRLFSMRIQRDIMMLGIEDTNSVILDSLMYKVPDDIYNTMLLSLRLEEKKTKFTSIEQYTDVLGRMSGPTTEIGRSPAPTNYDGSGGQMHNSAGPSRNSRHRQQRFNPVARPQEQLQQVTQPQPVVTPPASFTCDNCGPNRTHPTETCIQCLHCYKRGHTADNCRSRLRNDAGTEGSSNATAPNNVQ
ncbi:hypothetical protein BGZ70_004270, partial [Mortierella alpina]